MKFVLLIFSVFCFSKITQARQSVDTWDGHFGMYELVEAKDNSYCSKRLEIKKESQYKEINIVGWISDVTSESILDLYETDHGVSQHFDSSDSNGSVNFRQDDGIARHKSRWTSNESTVFKRNLYQHKLHFKISKSLKQYNDHGFMSYSPHEAKYTGLEIWSDDRIAFGANGTLELDRFYSGSESGGSSSLKCYYIKK